MKTYIDKDMTTIAQSAKVREDLKEFKARYTDGDLKHFFLNAINTARGYCSRVVEAVVEGFPAGSYFGPDETHFCVKLILDDADSGIPVGEIIKIRYYCDLDLNIRTEELPDGSGRKMYEMKVYTIHGEG